MRRERISTLFLLLYILFSATAYAADCSVTSIGMDPLYHSIFVPRTEAEESAGLGAANSIPAGRSVILSIGMSNAKGIWDAFVKDAEADPLKNPDVIVMNGAQAGGATQGWIDTSSTKTWGELDEDLDNENVSRGDITGIWFVVHNGVGHQTVEEYSTTLESDAREVLDLFVEEFPNLKVVWLQPMIYGGYSTAQGSQEPHARESAVVDLRLLEDQAWPFFVGMGPYLWADGLVPREDGLIWECSDFKDDGNHPDLGAKNKHSDYLLQFFHEDSIASIVYLDPGADLTEVPNVVGMDQASAEASIVAANLVVGEVTTANSDTVAAGDVISQSSVGGSSVPTGTVVDLIVSLGPAEQITVPDVVGLTQSGAEATLITEGLLVGAISSTSSDTVAAGNVISQNPAGGTTASLGSTVDLVISLGPSQPTTVPEVVDLPQATAETLIVDAGLVVGTVSTANSDTVVAGNVISQDPAGGVTADMGSAVDVVVSLGLVPDGPGIISPADGSTLSGSSETFTWSAGGAAVTNWRLDIGTSPGGRDILSERLGSSVTSQLVNGLPTDGSLVYVALKWKAGAGVEDASYVYTATGGGPPPDPEPAISSPTPGSTLALGDVSFTWSDNGAVADDWQLLVGSSVGDNSYYDSGILAASTTSAVVSGLPEDSSTIHVTLRWTDGGNASEASYTYTAANAGGGGGVPMMLSPSDGSVLSGASETFTWSAEGASVDKWRIEVGSSPDARDLFVQNIDSNITSVTVTGLPTDGSVVYVNLKWRISGVSSVASYIYTASTGGP